MVVPHPIKEFAEEVEPTVRKCLFCETVVSKYLPTERMIWKWRMGNRWYSNALLQMKTGLIARFYVCRAHFDRIPEAWEWAREGFDA